MEGSLLVVFWLLWPSCSWRPVWPSPDQVISAGVGWLGGRIHGAVLAFFLAMPSWHCRAPQRWCRLTWLMGFWYICVWNKLFLTPAVTSFPPSKHSMTDNVRAMCRGHTLICSVERGKIVFLAFHGQDIPCRWAQMGVHCSHGPHRGTCMRILLDWYFIAVITIIFVLLAVWSGTTGSI